DLRMIVEQTIHNNDFGVKFTLENFETEAPIQVDKDRLSQVLSYLFSKIADCSLSEKPAKITLSRKDGYIRIDITGFGYSIPQPLKTSLFQKFSKVLLPDNNKREKTGLELSLCKAIIESFDGTIDFETLPEGGTTFCIELPEVD
ncbi:MAG: HAMP domain-containing sensor histidine kinase, partial [bacterium]